MLKNTISHFTQKSANYTINRGKFTPPIITDSDIMLELGCGGSPIENSSKKYVGLDITPDLLRYLKKINQKVNLILGDVTQLPIRSKTIDTIVSNALLHHLISDKKEDIIKNIKKTINETKNVLKSHGVFVIRELNPMNGFIRDIMYYGSLFTSKYGFELPFIGLEKGVIVYFLTSRELKKMLEDEGYILEKEFMENWKHVNIPVGIRGWYYFKLY